MIEFTFFKEPNADQIKPIVEGVVEYGEGLVGTNKPEKYAIQLSLESELIGGVVGYRQYKRFYLTHIWVSASYRNRGYGSRLLIETEKTLRNSDCTSIMLETLNERAVKLYKQHDYSIVGFIQEYVQGFNLVHMMKEI